MLAPRPLPARYADWNREHRAPFGRDMRLGRVFGKTTLGTRWRGPFFWQTNNDTRIYEYPWVHEQVALRGRSLDTLEVGAGLSGLQFVLAREGHRVTNLDPGITPPGAASGGFSFSVSSAEHARLARVFRAPVRLIPETIGRAKLSDDSFDLVISVSAIEHFTQDALVELSQHLARVTRPGGLVILTIDLFLDLAPFTTVERNAFGENIDVRAFLESAGLRLETGRRDQLFGFHEFDPDAVQRNLGSLHVGSPYPTLSQCLTARVASPK